MTDIPVFHAFTIEYKGRVREIITDAGISEPLPTGDKIEISPDDPSIYHTKALWDTGATGCAITARAAKALTTEPNSKHSLIILFFVSSKFLISSFGFAAG